ncbi:hypothetical protein ACQP2H_24165 [Micromonospora sp. CA-248260]|uniref:hypothetical protein n=1 Tax=Micromonospora sp. CA-248260 TaxID=3239962 RepID=UPI003D90BFE8
MPLSKGGINDLANLRPACGPCNYGRGKTGHRPFQNYVGTPACPGLLAGADGYVARHGGY